MKAPLIIASLIFTVSPVFGQEPIRAKTDSGKEVILQPDGTWKYVSEGPPKPVVIAIAKSPSARKFFKPDRGSFGVWYDDTKWRQSTRPDEPGRSSFDLIRGDGYAIVLVEELGIPVSSLRRIALENAKEASPDAKIVFEETRMINGVEVLAMKIEGTIEQIPFRFYGYYYGGKQGTIQLLTYTGQALFSKYEGDFIEFLNGLEIYSEPSK